MIDIVAIEARLRGHPVVRRVSSVPRGHARIETALIYPDGASVDVFVRNTNPLLPPNELSDLGQTLSWLSDLQVRPTKSRRRMELLEDAVRVHGVTFRRGEIICPVSETLENLGDQVLRLAQSCSRVADLAFTKRLMAQSAFQEDVEEVLADTDLPYESTPELTGRFGKPVRVDFLVHSPSLDSAILTLASAHPSQAHNRVNEIFGRWFDLSSPRPSAVIPLQCVTVYDDSQNVYRDDDLDRLGVYSQVVAFSDRTTLMNAIRPQLN
jgi:hypothetical protein